MFFDILRFFRNMEVDDGHLEGGLVTGRNRSPPMRPCAAWREVPSSSKLPPLVLTKQLGKSKHDGSHDGYTSVP